MWIGSCELCGGSANWCVIGGAVHYYCLAQCDAFMQCELILGDLPWWKLSGRYRHAASQKESVLRDQLGSRRPSAGHVRKRHSPKPAFERPAPENPDQYQFPWLDTIDESRARQELLDDLLDQAAAALPESDDPK